MLMKIAGSTCAAALFSISAVAAQGQAPGAGQPGPQAGQQTGMQEITIVGCVQRESQYLEDARRDDPGRDLQATGNEYVLTQAEVRPMAGLPGQDPDRAVGTTGVERDRDGGQQPGQVGQAGQPGQQPGQAGQPGQQAHQAHDAGDDKEPVFSLTGDQEREFAQYVNQRVEIRGSIEHDQDRAVGTTGVDRDRDTAQPGQVGQQPGQAGEAGQPGQQDRPGQFGQPFDEDDMPEITVTSIRPVAGAC